MEIRMKNGTIPALLACLIFIFVFAANGICADLDDVLKGIKGRYGSASDLKAKFTQKTMVKTLGRSQSKTGTVWFKRPNKMRWDYVTPEKQQLITDGSTLWIYQPAEKVVFMRQIDMNNSVVVPMKVLSGEIDAKTQFDVKILKEEEGNILLELRPKQAAGFEKAVLFVSSKDFNISKIDVFDLYGNVTELILSEVKFNNKLKDSFFIYTPIPGVKVESPPVM